MDDERVIGWTPLRLEDPRDRSRVGCIGRQTVDGFGRHGDEPASPYHRDRCVQVTTHEAARHPRAPTNSSAASKKPNDSVVAK